MHGRSGKKKENTFLGAKVRGSDIKKSQRLTYLQGSEGLERGYVQLQEKRRKRKSDVCD